GHRTLPRRRLHHAEEGQAQQRRQRQRREHQRDQQDPELGQQQRPAAHVQKLRPATLIAGGERGGVHSAALAITAVSWIRLAPSSSDTLASASPRSGSISAVSTGLPVSGETSCGNACCSSPIAPATRIGAGEPGTGGPPKFAS